MSIYLTVYPALVALSAAISCGITYAAWRNRDIPGARWIGVLTAAVSVWGIAKLLVLYSSDLSVMLFWSRFEYVGVVIVPVAWVVFAFRYTGRGGWIHRRSIATLLVVPLLVSILIWTNDVHGLFRTVDGVRRYGSLTVPVVSLGPVFWLHTAYSYLLLLVGSWLIVQLVFLSSRRYDGQAIGLLVAVFVPWVGNGIYLTNVIPFGFDPTIMGLAGSGLILLGLVARYRLLQLVPAAKEVARDELIDSMSDAVLVVDARGQVVDANPAARTIVGSEPSVVSGRHLEDVCLPLADVVETRIPDDETLRTELSLVDDDKRRYYDVRVSVMTRGYGLVTGKLISLRDISEQRQHEQRLNVLNRLLRHDLRTELNVVKGHASLLADELEDASLRAHTDRVETAVTTIIERSEKFARVVKRLDGDDSGPVDLAADVAALVETTRRTHPDVDILLRSPDEAWTAAGPFVTTAIEELVANAIDHADRPDLEITITVTVVRQGERDVVRVEVADNGPGIPRDEYEPIMEGVETQLAHSTGVGLWLVTWIVQETGGAIDIDSGDDGSAVTITLPGVSHRHRPREDERDAEVLS